MPDHCTNCGLCCQHMRTPPFLGETDERWHALPQHLRDEIIAWMDSPRFWLAHDQHGDDFPCIWLDLTTGRCRHYELRPDVCREFEVGNESCRGLRQQVGLTVEGLPVVDEDMCEGCGEAPWACTCREERELGSDR